MKWLEAHPQKMSEVILDFAEPLLEYATDEASKRTAIGVAVIAWNLCLLKEEMPQQRLEDLLRNTCGEMPDLLTDDDFLRVLSTLQNRKRARFPNIRRHIWRYDFVRIEGKLHLHVASTVVLPKK